MLGICKSSNILLLDWDILKVKVNLDVMDGFNEPAIWYCECQHDAD